MGTDLSREGTPRERWEAAKLVRVVYQVVSHQNEIFGTYDTLRDAEDACWSYKPKDEFDSAHLHVRKAWVAK